MDNKKLDKIEEKVEEVREQQYEIKSTLVQMDTTLKHNHLNWLEHMARTDANERMIEELKESFIRHLSFVKGASWVIGTLWMVSLAIAGIALRIFL